MRHPIKTFTTTTKDGHMLQFFFNKETDLVVLDFIHKNERGGIELLRRHIDARLLKHCEK